MSPFQPMGVRRRLKNIMLQRKFDREARRAARKRDKEITALVKRSK